MNHPIRSRTAAFLLLTASLGWTSSTRAEVATTGEAAAVLAEARPFFYALSVRDVEASAEWYGTVFGFEEVRAVDVEARGLRIRLLRRAGAFLELTELDEARDLAELEPRLGKRHLLRGVFKIGFAVDDLDAVQARLAELDVPLRGEVITETDGSMRSLQIGDPDGNVIQLFELLGSTPK